MEHQYAVKIHAVEKYLLDELSKGERDEFEEHFFTCTQCAEEVKTGYAFIENSKAVFAEEAPRNKALVGKLAESSGWLGWFAWLRPATLAPAAAFVLLLGVAGYQSLILIPGLESKVAQLSSPRWLTVTRLRETVRGNVPTVKLQKGQSFIYLYFDVNSSEAFSQYTCEIHSDADGVIEGLTVTVPSKFTINLQLPVELLKVGHYTLIVRGQAPDSKKLAESEVGRYRFIIEN